MAGSAAPHEYSIASLTFEMMVFARGEKNAVGGAFAWLAFYAIAVVAVVVSNFHKAANVVVATAK